jgi:hypothetical protein
MSVERGKEDAERDEGYQARDWPQREGSLRRAERSIEPGSDRAGLRLFLRKAAELPADQRLEAVDAALAATGAATTDQQVDALLDRLYEGTAMADLETRQAMFEESEATLLERGDPMIALAADLRLLGEANEERDRALSGAKFRLRPQLVAGMRELKDGRLAPDANGTLRVAFGQVKGYSPRDATWYDAQTTVKGVLQKDTGQVPFNSPPELLQMARAARFGSYSDPDLESLPVAFLSTVNVTNGSSGSSSINAWGEIAGLAFDSNWEGVAADWVVNEDYVRTISVDSRYLLWVMDAIDGAHNLLREMDIPVQFPGSSAAGPGASRSN